MTTRPARRTLLHIAGTDTGVGKTLVTAALAAALRMRGADVVAAKPFASGCTPGCDWRDDDAQLLMAASRCDEPLDAVSPQRFAHPLAPATAAALEDRRVDIAGALDAMRALAARHSIVLVEGVGGVAVPLHGGTLASDFARQLGAPALVVARTALGTINHTLLTLEHLRARGVAVAGVVFVRHQSGPLSLAEETGVPLACNLAGTPCHGIVPHVDAFARAVSLDEAVDALPALCDAVQELAERIIAGEFAATG